MKKAGAVQNNLSRDGVRGPAPIGIWMRDFKAGCVNGRGSVENVASTAGFAVARVFRRGAFLHREAEFDAPPEDSLKNLVTCL